MNRRPRGMDHSALVPRTVRPEAGPRDARTSVSPTPSIFRSDPFASTRNHEAITGVTKPDQSTKSSTWRQRLRGDDLALCLPLRLLRLCLLRLCLLRHCALLANPSWRSDEVHLLFARAHMSMYYNEMKKTLSRLNEALTRAPNTMKSLRDAANFLSSLANYFARPEISPRIFCRCRKPL